MDFNENKKISALVEQMRSRKVHHYEAMALAHAIVHDTVGGRHPVIKVLDDALKSDDARKQLRAARSVVTLYDEGMLKSPRLAIAHEIEGDILNIAEDQVKAAEKSTDETHKQLQLAIAAFLAGATLEDALRRMCDAENITYDPQKTTISTLQSGLYQPSKNIEVISRSENKQITAWAETRNNADHGRFSILTHTEVLTMVIGIRAFIDKHLP